MYVIWNFRKSARFASYKHMAPKDMPVFRFQGGRGVLGFKPSTLGSATMNFTTKLSSLNVYISYRMVHIINMPEGFQLSVCPDDICLLLTWEKIYQIFLKSLQIVSVSVCCAFVHCFMSVCIIPDTRDYIWHYYSSKALASIKETMGKSNNMD